jgi:hypothetical protein
MTPDGEKQVLVFALLVEVVDGFWGMDFGGWKQLHGGPGRRRCMTRSAWTRFFVRSLAYVALNPLQQHGWW